MDDVIIGENGKAPFVVLAVGGFLGIGGKLVVLPYEQLKTMDRKIVMPGATKDAWRTCRRSSTRRTEFSSAHAITAGVRMTW